ncbi:MAG: DUF2157 domain-containing protein [Chitinophagales bacterium]
MLPDFIGSQWLRGEIEEWLKEDLITDEQANRLAQKYDLNKEAPWFLRSSFILKGVALLFTAMGLFLFISQNWHYLGIWQRMMITLLPLLISGGMAIKYAFDKEDSATELALFFSSLALGANIYMQAQIFHIDAYFPDGILWWILGSLPVMLYFRSNLLGFALQGLFMMWLSLQMDFNQFSFWGILIFAAFAYTVYRKPNWVMLFGLMVIGAMLVFNIFQNTIGWERFFRSEGQFFLFLASYALLVLTCLSFVEHQYPKRIIQRFQTIGLWGIIFLFFGYTFNEFIEEMVSLGNSLNNYIIFGAALGIGVLNHRKISIDIWIGFAIVAILMVWNILGFENVSDYKYEVSGDTQLIIKLVMNALFFAFSVWRIFYGIRHRIKSAFMSGIFFLLLLALSRYIDYFDNYVFTSLAFILSGIGIYLLNNFWNKRFGD